MTRTEWHDKLYEQLRQLGIKLKQLGADSRNVFIPEYEVIVPKILDLILDTNLTDDPASTCKIVTATDRERRVAAELRTTMNPAAIQKTLDLFSEQTLEGEFDRLIILVLTFDRRITRDPFDKCFFKPHEDLWNLQTLFEKVSALEDEKNVEHISRYIAQMLDVSFERPDHVLSAPPPGTDTFVGREHELYRLRRMLSTQKHIVISGDGGIGKTEIVLRMAQMYAPPKGAFFIRYEEPSNKTEHKVIRDLILRAHFSGYQYSGQDNDNRDQEYAERLDILRKEYRDALLIIDNFDLSKKGMQEVFQESEFRDLVSTGAYLVFTTRYENPESLKIGPMDDEILLDFMRLFLNDMQVEDKDLLELIRYVNGHTYMVELMARTMGQSWGLIDPKYFTKQFLMLTDNSDVDSDDDSDNETWYPDVSTARNGYFESRNIYGHMRVVFEVSKLSEMDQYILRYASLLPVNGMERNLFWDAVADCEEDKLQNEDETGRDNIINSITARGWLRRENDILTIHPVVRLICRDQLMPTYDNCKHFLDALWRKYTTRDYDKENFRQLAELFEVASKVIDDNEGICSLRAGLFWHRLGKLQEALDCYQETVHRQENSETNEVDLVRTYNKIGSAYQDLGKREDAYKNFKEALNIAEKNPAVEKVVLAATYDNIGKTLGDLGKYNDALEYHLKVLQIRELMYPAGHPFWAVSYTNIGSIYTKLGDYKKALEYSLKALEIREKMISSDDDLNLAASYNNVGGNYMHLGSYTKALEYLLKALFIREQFLPYDHPDLATSYNNVGGLYRYFGNYEKALEYFMKALDIRKRVLPQNHPDTAQTYGNIARIYCSLGDYHEALDYINQASKIAKITNHRDQMVYQNAENLIRSLMEN